MENLITTKTSSLTGGGVSPRHNPLGKNGTFWMPPKSSSSFAEVMGTKKKVANPEQSNRSTVKSKVQSTLRNPPPMDHRTKNVVESQKPRFFNQSNGVKLLSSGNSVRSPLISSFITKPNASSSHLAKLNSFASVVNKNAHAVPLDKTTAYKSNHLTQLKSSFLYKDTGQKEEKRRGRGGGANRASLDCDAPLDSKSFLAPDEFDSNNKEKSHLRDNLLKSVSEGITPRISQLNKEGYVAIRFSQDLPDGKKYSVKIEKQEKEVRFNFISPDPSTRKILEHTMTSLINLLRDSFPSEVNIVGRTLKSFSEI